MCRRERDGRACSISGSRDLIWGTTIKGKANTLLLLRNHPLDKHSTAREARNFIGPPEWENFHTFSTVRHPCKRIYSLYQYVGDLLERRSNVLSIDYLKSRFTNFWEWPSVRIYQATEDFSSFIRHPDFVRMRSARSMFDWLSEDGQLLVKRVLRVESLNDDFRALMADLGIESYDLPHINSSDRSKKKSISTDMSAGDMEYIKNLYEKDMTFFGYE